MNKVKLVTDLLTMLLVSCGSDSSSQYTYHVPEKTGDGLDVGTLDEVNMDSTLLGKAVDRIQAGKYGEVHSLLIFMDGKLVFEEYFPGHEYQWDGPNHHGAWVEWDRDRSHISMSAGKSITGACVGIAIEEGFIESVDQSIFDYLPDHQYLNTDGKGAITIEHLLTMTSGLAWDEWGAPYSSLENDLVRLVVECDDQVACILEAPLVSEPGTDFAYSGGSLILLGEIIKNASGMDIETFSNEYLFAPLGIDPVEWRRFDSGVVFASGEQPLTPRGMVKFGATFLSGGVWNGQRIISEQWVENSATPFLGNTQIKVPGSDSGRRGYSYTWWTKQFSESDAFFAAGWGGQDILVFPELDAVVVFTGGNYAEKVRVFTILEKFVLPAFN